VYKKVLAIIFLLLVAAGGIYYVYNTYTVETVYVEGNVHYTEDEIKAFVMEGPLGNNSLYLSMKYKNKGVRDVPFVDVMDVSILSPNTIKITVYEKALAGYVRYLDSYMYFDKDGCVVESSGVKTVGVPQITGLTFDYMILGEPLPVENKDIFGTILNLTKYLNKYDLISDKIYFHPGGQITVYFDEVKVAMGKEDAHLEDKIMLLPTFLVELTGKSGTLQMEKYEDTGGRFTFKPD
jgi:cell division protein FtsQ